MTQFQPPQETQALIQKANKLRSLVANPGWTDVFEPHIREEIEGFKRVILTGDFTEIVELKANQEKLKFQEYVLSYVYGIIAEADELQKEDAIRVATKSAKQQETAEVT